jgi:carboxyvinyl-carboxyphosphonate phosphorylmutase
MARSDDERNPPAAPRSDLRAVLGGETCVRLASVFDPLSARMATELGFEAAILAGSVASLVVLGAPDLTLLTLTELADQVRRICRAGPPPLVVDADHGYGNALNAARTVEELHAAGAAGLTLEDTLLPQPFGGSAVGLIGIDEAVGKLEAAIEARPDPSFAVIARSSAYRAEGIDAALQRVERYARTGADAIFVTGLKRHAEVAALRDAAAGLPLMLYSHGLDVAEPAELAPLGVRLLIEGHMSSLAAAEAAWDVLSAQRHGSAVPPPRHPGLLGRLTGKDDFARRTARYLMPRRADRGE